MDGGEERRGEQRAGLEEDGGRSWVAVRGAEAWAEAKWALYWASMGGAQNERRALNKRQGNRSSRRRQVSGPAGVRRARWARDYREVVKCEGDGWGSQIQVG